MFIISEINTYLPGVPVGNEQLEAKIRINGNGLPPGFLGKTMGCRYRYYAAPEEQASDLAVKAALPILQKSKTKIDWLIFASASADLIEPATSNIVMAKLGLSCPAFDVKNACNSVLTAMEIAGSLLQSNRAKNILIVSGEKPSDSIRFEHDSPHSFKDHFAAYSFGDGGVAILLSHSPRSEGIFYQKSRSYGEHWPLCTIPGGGSMFPHHPDKMYFSGKTFELKHIIKDLLLPFVEECCRESGVNLQDVKYICTHQVAAGIYEEIAGILDLPLQRFLPLFHLYGNTASVSVPLALNKLMHEKKPPPGSVVMLLGLAAGISLNIQFLRI